jgi:hypothetical protein
MRRLYFLVPDTQIGEKVADELLLAHVEWQHIHVIAKRGTRLEAFEQAIERGELLVIADVPRGEVGQITERIRKVHPKVDPEGTEPRVPAFP